VFHIASVLNDINVNIPTTSATKYIYYNGNDP